MHRQNFEKIVLVSVFTTFMGQIYLTPFGSTFRFTFAVVVLNLLLLTFQEIKIVPTINTVGLMMFVVRSVVFISSGSGTLLQAFMTYYPILFFYAFYSLFFSLLDVKSLVKAPLALFLAIWICDSIPNIIEVVIRQEWKNANFEEVIYSVILIGLIRTFMTTVLYYISRRIYTHTKERENHQVFVDRILLLSNLKTELFFLRKSKHDIEEAMRRSFIIYEKVEQSDLKASILAVTKDIHEIKKDYSRVISGLEKSVKESPIYQMSFKEIADIVVEANKKVAYAKQIKVFFHTSVGMDFKTEEYLAMISILNNIVTNAIEAFKIEGTVTIKEWVKAHQIIIEVSNDGDGIDKSDLPLIFEAGFSTKFNENNGIMASGIGLTHVKHLVEDFLEGSITADSHEGQLTHFTITVPYDRLAYQNTSD